MKILISPIGNQDPHGKPDRETGEFTEGSAITICRVTQPDKVILLPTRCPNGRDTYANGNLTKEYIMEECGCTNVEVQPQDMEAASNYEEALQVYGNTLTRLAQEHSNDTLLHNASSGTPAIKVACLLCIAEGRIAATPWYADDPTESLHTGRERVREFDVSFLRESALMQRVCGLIGQGQFALAAEALTDLTKTQNLARRQWAKCWLILMSVLQGWDERRYTEARQSLAGLRAHWSEAPAVIKAALKEQQSVLDKLVNPGAHHGLIAWDIYFGAVRLQEQGHLNAALEHFWIANENVVGVFFQCHYPEEVVPKMELSDALNVLAGKNDTTYQSLWKRSFEKATVSAKFWKLRTQRNQAIHRGEAATPDNLKTNKDLAKLVLTAFGCQMPSDYPLSPDALRHLASMFSASGGA